MFGDPYFWEELVSGIGEVLLTFAVLRFLRNDSTRRLLTHSPPVVDQWRAASRFPRGTTGKPSFPTW